MRELAGLFLGIAIIEIVIIAAFFTLAWALEKEVRRLRKRLLDALNPPTLYRVGDRLKVIHYARPITDGKPGHDFDQMEGHCTEIDPSSAWPYRIGELDNSWFSESEVELVYRPGLKDQFL